MKLINESLRSFHTIPYPLSFLRTTIFIFDIFHSKPICFNQSAFPRMQSPRMFAFYPLLMSRNHKRKKTQVGSGFHKLLINACSYCPPGANLRRRRRNHPFLEAGVKININTFAKIHILFLTHTPRAVNKVS